LRRASTGGLRWSGCSSGLRFVGCALVKVLSQREIRRRTGLHRDTIRKALKSKEPPVYRRAPSGSKLDPFKDEIHRPLSEDPRLSGVADP